MFNQLMRKITLTKICMGPQSYDILPVSTKIFIGCECDSISRLHELVPTIYLAIAHHQNFVSKYIL